MRSGISHERIRFRLRISLFDKQKEDIQSQVDTATLIELDIDMTPLGMFYLHACPRLVGKCRASHGPLG